MTTFRSDQRRAPLRPDAHGPGGLVHPALVYESDESFLATCVPFLREGLTLGEQALAVTSARNIDLLSDAMGPDAGRVDFHEARTWLTTPWRAQHAYRRYVEGHAAGGARVRVIGEPFAPERTPAAVVEWTRYESMLNIAFTELPLTILCPYDTRALPRSVVEHAYCTHPVLLERKRLSSSAGYADTAAFSATLDEIALDTAAGPVAERAFDDDLAAVRRFVSDEARLAGVPRAAQPDLMLAAHEIASNALRHGGGRGVVRTWSTAGEFVCEIADEGAGLEDPLAGHVDPGAGEPGGRGLWLARQLCDLVQVRSGPAGTVVRLHVRV